MMKKSDKAGTKRLVLASENGSGPYGLVCAARGHFFLSDKPESSGGTDGGPDPFELLMGSLAACTAMTLRMYVDRRAFDVGTIRVSVEHEDSGGAPEPPMFRRMISLGRAVDDPVLQKLRDIADRCPVHRVIAAGSRVETRFVESRHRTEVEEG
ncbi:MAG: OsmC family protein [Burkholderiaceae bacterium]|nr:OsmC family protein [Burkholderiaceae bacterium]